MTFISLGFQLYQQRRCLYIAMKKLVSVILNNDDYFFILHLMAIITIFMYLNSPCSIVVSKDLCSSHLEEFQ